MDFFAKIECLVDQTITEAASTIVANAAEFKAQPGLARPPSSSVLITGTGAFCVRR